MQDRWAASARVFYDNEAGREFDTSKYRIFVRAYEKIYSRLQLKRSSRILDLGCGCGEMTYALKNKVQIIVGIDVSFKSLELARRNNPDDSFVVADMSVIPLGDEQFDSIIAMTSLEFCQDRRRAFYEIHRLLKDNGIFYAEVRNFNFLPLRLVKPINNFLVKIGLIVPRSDGLKDLSYEDWHLLLKEAGFKIIKEYPSLRPWNYGSVITRFKNLIIRLILFTTAFKNHYILGFLCTKKK